MGSGSSRVKDQFYIGQVTKTWKSIDKTITRKVDHDDNEPDDEPKPPPPIRFSWQIVKVYVCSTFRDFFYEREILALEVFPKLRQWCFERKLHLIECDLRWRIPRNSNPKELMIHALNEIDRCREVLVNPIFIALIGQRIGWIPKVNEIPKSAAEKYQWVKDISMTEMEIIHGAYRTRNPNALFLIKDAESFSKIPVDQKHNLVDGNPYASYKLKGLKMKLKARFPEDQIVSYSCQFAGVDLKTKTAYFHGMGHFKKSIFQFLKDKINENYSGSFINDKQSLINNNQNEHMKRLSYLCRGRDDFIPMLVKNIVQVPDETNGPIVISGGQGVGKSVCLARAAEHCQRMAESFTFPSNNKNLQWSVIYHSAEASSDSRKANHFFGRLLEHFKQHKAIKSAEIQPVHMLYSYLCNPCAPPLVILIDALDTLDQDVLSLLKLKLASQIRCILAIDDSQLEDFKNRFEVPTSVRFLPLDDLNKTAAKNSILENLEAQNWKTLSNDAVKTLFDKQYSGNPLWLRISIKHLFAYDGESDDVVDAARDIPDDLRSLIDMSLDQVEQIPEIGFLAISTLCFIECSSRGLFETELKDLLGGITCYDVFGTQSESRIHTENHDVDPDILEELETSVANQPEEDICSELDANSSSSILVETPAAVNDLEREMLDNDSPDEDNQISEPTPSSAAERKVTSLPTYTWSSVYQLISSFICPFGNPVEGKLWFSHRSFRTAVKSRYLAAEERVHFWHSHLAKYFAESILPFRLSEEYPIHLAAIGDFVALEKCLTDWQIFDYYFDADYSTQLIELWKKTPNGTSGMGVLYQNEINGYARRFYPIANVIDLYGKIILLLTQAGEHNSAEILLPDLIDLYNESNYEQPEDLMDMFWTLGYTIEKAVKNEKNVLKRQIDRIVSAIHYYEECLENLEHTGWDESEYLMKKAEILHRLADCYAGLNLRRINNEFIKFNEAKAKSFCLAEESILLYQRLSDEHNQANVLVTRGISCGRAVPEQLKFYQQAEEILIRTQGRLAYDLDSVYYHKGVYYEEIGDFNRSFECFKVWFELCLLVYGQNHHRTQKAELVLHEPVYTRVARMKQEKQQTPAVMPPIKKATKTKAVKPKPKSKK